MKVMFIKFKFIDEIGNEPIKENWVKCEVDEDTIPTTISRLNGMKWKGSMDFNSIKRKIYALNDCELVKTKKTMMGGYSGGPLGKREYTFPSVVEYPYDKEIEDVDASIKCLQEGVHLFCSLDPEIL